MSPAAKRLAVQGNPQDLSPTPANQSLLACWQRSKELGADPEGSNALENALVGRSALREAQQGLDPLWRSAHTIIEDFAATCARRDFVTLISDAQGIVTQSLGGGAFADEARRLRLIEGAMWDEALRGTNAIGTALAESRPIAVHGAAHFAQVK
ncbi:MAG: hypothetical protein R3F17_09220 [Planctomycetota bacterium]